MILNFYLSKKFLQNYWFQHFYFSFCYTIQYDFSFWLYSLNHWVVNIFKSCSIILHWMETTYLSAGFLVSIIHRVTSLVIEMLIHTFTCATIFENGLPNFTDRSSDIFIIIWASFPNNQSIDNIKSVKCLLSSKKRLNATSLSLSLLFQVLSLAFIYIRWLIHSCDFNINKRMCASFP